MDEFDLQLRNIARADEEAETKAGAKMLGLPYVSLVGLPIEPDVLTILPKDGATANRVVAFGRKGNEVSVASDVPKAKALQPFLKEMTAATKMNFHLAYCSKTSLEYALALYKVLAPEAPKEQKVEVTAEKEESFEKTIESFEDLKEKITQVPTTDLLDLIFAGAVKNEASDIHLEPQENKVRIRYRIDGVLQDVADLAPESYHPLAARIKYLAKLKLDVTHPQDGRFTITVGQDEIDIRVASLPSNYGEAFVMRLLTKGAAFTTLENLGFRPDALALIEEAISLPQGVILNTGPTGSGKTTTLYAILQKLNQPEKKIITMENPIEFRVDGIEQIQVDTENKTAFLDILKGSLRQDPDVMMIGEIRDAETANIALQAAMTGHLVLSTLHTNNAPSAFARLADLGVPAYLMAGTINLIIGQRLVRKICQDCQGQGCDACRKTGYRGRVALVEVLKPTREIEELIQKKAPLRDFEETAKKLGMKTMHEDGLEKVAAGITTKEEVERVTKE